MGYHRLALEERYQIHVLLGSSSLREISRRLGRSPSTISRELKGWKDYRPRRAQMAAKFNRTQGRPKKLVGTLEQKVRKRILLDWSPEQIAGRLKRDGGGEQVSFPAIYRYVYQDAHKGGDLWTHLRRQRKRRKIRGKWLSTREYAKGRVFIHDRPKAVESRKRFGDFERDLIKGTCFEPVILSLVDRKSKLTKIAWIKKKSKILVHQATVKLLKKGPLKTITNDNGGEFLLHKTTAKELKTKIYFCTPHASWQRGTNENTNGLLRQYFPKGTNFSQISKADLQRAERRLNRRPRKGLSYRSPVEVHPGPIGSNVALIS